MGNGARRSLSPALFVAMLVAAGNVCTAPLAAQDRGIEVDFLLNYYDQDGDHSPVTGGIGTEDLQVVAPTFVVRFALNDEWSLTADLGVDNISSASTDNIDLGVTDFEVSSASEQDNRAYTAVTASRKRGNQTWSFGAGFSSEYDYNSLSGRVGWSVDLNDKNTTFAVGLQHYQDNVELYDIDGQLQGEDDRQTTDLSLSLTQVLGPNTVGTVELAYTMQDGFLSTPFHEVILAPTDASPEGRRVAERFPDSRERLAIGLSINHAFGRRVVQRASYRFYDDDFGIAAHTFEAETHFRLPGEGESWVFPILRFHTQDASDFFGLPGTFSGDEPLLTADRDLSGFDSEKLGLGFRTVFKQRQRGWLRRLRSFETRITNYSRDDGLDAFSASLALGFRF